ncbi:MAG: hypothetical protein ACI9KE_004066 [Polyangiales bacterium]|jgi:hypothetical protein
MATKKSTKAAGEKKASARKGTTSKDETTDGETVEAVEAEAVKANAATADAATADAEPADAETADAEASGEDSEGEDADKLKKLTGAAADAAKVLEAENRAARIAELAEGILDSRSSVATKAARVLHEIVLVQPEALVSQVERFARGLTSKHKRVVQASADALPAIAKIAPARVAKHLDVLKDSFEPAILDGKDGLVRTFANLCTASVAYQKRLEPVLTLALETADGKSLLRWSEIVLPALKGEPHARARSVVEDRLDRIPRAIAQQIASTMNFKLRVRYR